MLIEQKGRVRSITQGRGVYCMRDGWMWASLRGCGGIEYSDDRFMGFY